MSSRKLWFKCGINVVEVSKKSGLRCLNPDKVLRLVEKTDRTVGFLTVDCRYMEL